MGSARLATDWTWIAYDQHNIGCTDDDQPPYRFCPPAKQGVEHGHEHTVEATPAYLTFQHLSPRNSQPGKPFLNATPALILGSPFAQRHKVVRRAGFLSLPN